jgi:hypothetical protein
VGQTWPFESNITLKGLLAGFVVSFFLFKKSKGKKIWKWGKMVVHNGNSENVIHIYKKQV